MRIMLVIKNKHMDFSLNATRFSIGEHEKHTVIWIHLVDNYDIKSFILKNKNLKPKWSATKKLWYILDNPKHRQQLSLPVQIVGKEVLMKISPFNRSEFQKYQNTLVLKGFSQNTIRTYTVEFAQLLYTIKDYPVQKLTSDKLQSYFLYCHKILNLKENQIHSRMNAIKFYFEKVLHSESMFFDIPRPKKPLLLPKYLTKDEIKMLFKVTDNIKHLMILKLCYGMGLRVSEVVNLKIENINSQDNKVHIQHAKGKKDRYVNLPESILMELRIYYLQYKPLKYLFEGKYPGEKYSVRSVQAVFKNTMKTAGINKTIGVHGLRHSYATHLLEMGTDISLIQELMGHNNIKTTQIYTHVTEAVRDKIKSPLDFL